MKANKSQKNKLTDTFGRLHDYLRISLTERCSMRCFYCMPEEGIPLGDSSRIMNKDEVFALAKTFVDFGIYKIRLTGGEPLVCRDAAAIISKLAELPVELAITTNGVLVDKFIDVFKKSGLRNINISLDSLQKEKFNQITRRNYFDKVMSNIQLLLKEDFHLKLNTVIIRNTNEEEIIDFVEWTRNTSVHIRFIEFMPFDSNKWKRNKVVSYQEILERVESVYPIEKLQDSPHSTSKSFKVKSFIGTFAVISSVTSPFCESCNRLRLTADGKLRNCLFASNEFDLLTPFREGQNINALIEKVVKDKAEQLGGLPEFQKEKMLLSNLSDRSMVKIGG